jgi:hypothetical protein
MLLHPHLLSGHGSKRLHRAEPHITEAERHNCDGIRLSKGRCWHAQALRQGSKMQSALTLIPV